MIQLIIDGKKVHAEEGTTVLMAAEMADIEIPHLCYDERLEPIASCRLCLVEVNGSLVTSCAYPVKEGIEVKQEAKKLKALAKLLSSSY